MEMLIFIIFILFKKKRSSLYKCIFMYMYYKSNVFCKKKKKCWGICFYLFNIIVYVVIFFVGDDYLSYKEYEKMMVE